MDSNNSCQQLGDIALNKPDAFKIKPRINELYRSMNLKTCDILGSRPVPSYERNFVGRERRFADRNTMSVEDIDGASPRKSYDSMKSSSRRINPLEP